VLSENTLGKKDTRLDAFCTHVGQELAERARLPGVGRVEYPVLQALERDRDPREKLGWQCECLGQRD
jgi:hypothetical protein